MGRGDRSRVEPPLALARLRAADELAEFRQHDLRFNDDEVAALLRRAAGSHAGLESAATSARAARAHPRLGGRTAPEPVSAARRRRAAQSGGRRPQRHLFDYLAAEVLDDMPAELRDFLLRCSVLPELTAARCAPSAAMPHAARLLEEIERRGLFVTVLDADEPTLRLHDLFRDFLEDRLRRDMPDELPELLRRAADRRARPAAHGRLPDPRRRLGRGRRARWCSARRSSSASVRAPALRQMLTLFPAAELNARAGPAPACAASRAWPRFDWDTLRVSHGARRGGLRARPAASATPG